MDGHSYTKILSIPDNTGYWLVRADGGKYYDDFFLNNFVSIADNEITLKEIQEEFKRMDVLGNTFEGYKQIYFNIYSDWKPQQIAHGASRIMKFMDDMKVNDLVLVPSKSSLTYLIGIIQSEPYEIKQESINQGIHLHYNVNPYTKRRKVKWIKEVDRSEMSEKLYWMLSAHQSIFDLSDYEDQINRLLAPTYIKNGMCHSTVKVNKSDGLTTDEWYDLFSIIKEVSGDSSEKIIAKNNVQSPGYLEFITSLTNTEKLITLSSFITGYGFLFSKVKVGNMEILGFVPYFFNEGKLNREKLKHENRSLELDNKLKEIEVEQKRALLQPIESEAERLRTQLHITNFDAGRPISNQTQTDNVGYQDAGESGQ
jgi:predicted Mrr-cat superfamily restriction endonuclease